MLEYLSFLNTFYNVFMTILQTSLHISFASVTHGHFGALSLCTMEKLLDIIKHALLMSP